MRNDSVADEKRVLILARTMQHAKEFARSEGLAASQWKYAASVRSIEGLSNMRIAMCGEYWMHPEYKALKTAVEQAIAVAGCVPFDQVESK